MDETRFTTLACYAMCGPFNRSAFVTDVVSWNLYLGWYVPGLFLNKLWFGFFHLVHPTRALGMSEYGCEAMPNLHSSKPRCGDHSEEYQCVYHEYMAKFFAERPWVWASHVWNMFDFAADARDQIHVKVYSNQPQVTLVVNGHEVATKACDRVFEFDVSLQQGENRIEARAGGLSDEAAFIRVSAPNPAYSLQGKGGGGNWT